MIHDIKIITYSDSFRDQVFNLIFNIQKKEFGLAVTIENPPGLESIPLCYQKNNGNFWLALDNGALVGTIGLQVLNNDQAALKRLYVKPPYRSYPYHLGKKLLDTLVVWARKQGLKEIFLGTRTAYQAANHFYHKNGFQEIAQEELPSNFPLAKVDTIFYRLDI